MWPIMTGQSSTTPHVEIVIGYNFTGRGAIISGNYKPIIGKQSFECDSLMWSPLDYPCTNGPTGDDCDPYCLYDIVNDPTEKNNLGDKDQDMLKVMVEKYNNYSKDPPSNYGDSHLPINKDACKYMVDGRTILKLLKKSFAVVIFVSFVSFLL